MATNLTLKRLYAIGAALDAALAGAGFDGGDFDGMDARDFELARIWVDEQIARRERTEGEG